MTDGWLKVMIGIGTSLLAVGVAYGTLRGRVNNLEEEVKTARRRLNKHSNEIDELMAIKISMAKVETSVDGMLVLLKEVRDEQKEARNIHINSKGK